MRRARILVLTTGLAATLVGGCASRVGGSYTTSAFYRRCQDLNGIAVAAAKEAGFNQRGGMGGGGGSSSGPTGRESHQDQSVDLSGRPADVGKLMKSLLSNFEMVAGATGAMVTAGADSKIGDTAPASFTLEYADGPNHGKVEVSIDAGKPDSLNRGLMIYTLKLRLEERAP